ncbi:hypothetical protein ACLK2E_20390 [Escherichia coli]
MAASRPYADTMRKVIGHLANGNLEYSTLTWKNATLNAWATWWCLPTVVCAVA